MAVTTETETIQAEAFEMTPATSTKLHPDSPTLADVVPEHESEANQRWGKEMYLKLISAGFCFFVAGVNDGSIGALLPYVIREYEISTAIVSSVYGANFLGWLSAALINTHLCQYLDLGAMLALGAFCQIAAHALRAWDAPFGLFVTTFWFVSIGQAFQDTHANTFVAGVKGAHRWLAFIHAMYMAGCLIGPFVATGVASAGTVSRWYLFYTFPLGLGVANLAMVLVAFRDTVRLKKAATSADRNDALSGNVEDPSQPQQQSSTDETGTNNTEVKESRNQGALNLIAATVKIRSVWLLCLFFFFYLGSSLTASGWVVEFLVDVRHGDLSQVGYVPAGFNGGGLLGRLLLAEPAHRFGERRMVFFYCVAAIALQLVFWLVPSIIAASIAISFMGFFTAPLFPIGISLGSKLFPKELHSTALALVFVFAQMGGSLFPIITGVVSSKAGVKVLQPILVALMAATAISWLLVPRPKSSSSNNAELHQE